MHVAIRSLAIAFCGMLPMLGAGAQAEEPVLTLTGAVTETLTLEDLREIGTTELSTETPWTEGTQVFVGVSGADFVESVGGEGTDVIATALNDYSVVIPFEVFADATTLIAFERNDEVMSVREKGPIWIVFPFDEAGFDRDVYRTYAIWSLDRLEFR